MTAMSSLVVPEDTLSGILHKILTFIYFIAHQIGVWITNLLQAIFSSSAFPNSLIDPLGFLIILTLFVFLVGYSSRIAWIIVTVAWILLVIRIFMIIFKLG